MRETGDEKNISAGCYYLRSGAHVGEDRGKIDMSFWAPWAGRGGSDGNPIAPSAPEI